MWEFLGKLARETLDLFKKNYKKPRLWIVTSSILVALFMLLPYIDSNFFYYNRMEKRVGILQQVMALDSDKIESNPIYKEEYDSILKEMQQQDERNINSIMNKFISSSSGMTEGTDENKIRVEVIKFCTGALIWIVLLICIPFMNTFKKGSDKIIAFIIIAAFAIVLGWIGIKLPILIHPIVNYIGFPILQVGILIYLMNKDG